jgi:hypothetical protein
VYIINIVADGTCFGIKQFFFPVDDYDDDDDDEHD